MIQFRIEIRNRISAQSVFEYEYHVAELQTLTANGVPGESRSVLLPFFSSFY